MTFHEGLRWEEGELQRVKIEACSASNLGSKQGSSAKGSSGCVRVTVVKIPACLLTDILGAALFVVEQNRSSCASPQDVPFAACNSCCVLVVAAEIT